MVVVLETWVLVVILVFSMVLVVSQNLTCNSDDLTGLRGFMSGLEAPIDGWLFANSSSSNNCCNWVGVICDSSSGRIVGLQLPNKRLSGDFSHSIFNLVQLKTLNLSHNYLKGPVPISLFRLPHLEVVDLSSNYFNGDSFPSGLCVNSTRIRDLRFAVNYFTGIIPPQFVYCTSLEHLSMASNFLTGVIPDMLFRLPRLQELAIQDNRFTSLMGTGNFSSRLVSLDVSSNRLSGNIPDVFHNFPNLSYFSAHSNSLSGVMPRSLLNSQTISSLILGNNSLDGSVEFNCTMMVSLTSLDLGSNNFSGTIPASFASCRKLKAINLSRNKLMGQIPESFKNFESLSYLSLSNCSFSNLSASLRILQHCPNLTVLLLTMNFYAEQLPSHDDLHFKSLKALVIANCRLTGSIPLWLNGLTQMQLLDLSWNDLTGTIPAYLGDFKSLFYLDLSNNSLSGEIPKSLTQLPSLISRDISLEEPALDFPFFKKQNTSYTTDRGLQYRQIMSFRPSIDLSGNHLTGPIWPEFGGLKKLHVLDLRKNNLSGTIPSSLSGMRNIETLDLSYNSLTGTIPPSLVRLSFLSKFSVAFNNLSGIVPLGGQFSTFTNASFEGNRGLCDGIYTCESRTIPDSTGGRPKKKTGKGVWFENGLAALTGFGTGFIVTVISLLVVPRIRGTH
ncbi:putative non-specific serine/threonine protein kinase [Helianthus annuus]|nr:putative non-specific serine/threonine protein kinase [Helianthus annuus]